MMWTFSSSDSGKAHRARANFLNALKVRAANRDDLGACEVIFGELVANVVQHAPGRIRIVLDWNGDRAILSVEDAGPDFTLAASMPSDPLEEHGRGLYMICALGGTIDVERRNGGKTVRVTLPVQARAG